MSHLRFCIFSLIMVRIMKNSVNPYCTIPSTERNPCSPIVMLMVASHWKFTWLIISYQRCPHRSWSGSWSRWKTRGTNMRYISLWCLIWPHLNIEIPTQNPDEQSTLDYLRRRLWEILLHRWLHRQANRWKFMFLLLSYSYPIYLSHLMCVHKKSLE